MQISSTAVIGVGGTGQSMLPSLIRLLQYHPSGTTNVVAYDGDQFEEHNGARQIHTSGSKAERMNELLSQQMLPTVCRDSYMNKSKLEALRRRHPEGTLLVVAAVDNDATRKMCIDVLNDIPGDFLFVTPGNSTADDPEAAIRGNVLWFGRVSGEQIGIRPDLLFVNIEHPKDGIPRKGSCIEDAPSSPQLIAANALAAAFTLTVIQNFLDDRMPLQASHMFFNGRTLSTTAN